MLVASSVVAWALLQPTAAKPVRTTLEKLQARAHPVGARVELQAVVLPLTAIQVQSAGKTRYFALAVPGDGRYLTTVKSTIEEVWAALPAALKQLEAAIDSDTEYRAKQAEFEKLHERLDKLLPVPGEAVAVELQAFEAVSGAYTWETVIGERTLRPLALPSPSLRPSFSVSDAMERLQKMAAARPPDLAQALPNYSGPKLFNTRPELRAFNRMVDAFNAELARRRRYSVQLSSEQLALGVARLERALVFRDGELQGAVIAKDDLAGRAFTQAQGGLPAAWLRETAPKGQSVADRHFARTSLLVASFPSPASVELGGKAVGSTPLIVPDVAVGSELQLLLERPGFARKQAREKVTPVPAGVRRIELALDPIAGATAPAAAAPEEIWFVDASATRVTVTQEAALEWKSPDGKLSRPELTLRCAGGEKEVYLYNARGFGAPEGDLFIRFENEDKPKKYWGAPSQNGRSLFFTGFWGKGTDGVVKALLEHRTMSLTVKPKKLDPLPELVFDLRGLDKALTDWLKACPLKK